MPSGLGLVWQQDLIFWNHDFVGFGGQTQKFETI